MVVMVVIVVLTTVCVVEALGVRCWRCC